MNELGLHARPAAEFVRCASSHACEIFILLANGERHNAKSILDVLTACLAPGASFTLQASGEGAEAAANELEQLMKDLATRESEEERGVLAST